VTKEYLIGGIELDLSELDSMVIGNDLPVAEAEEVVKNSDNAIDKIKEFYELSEKISNLQKYGGFHKWFVPGTPYGIDKLHKHRAFLFAGAKYHERYASWSNQTGKTTSAAYELTLHLTGLYPEWWEGRRFNQPISAYAAGSTNETTRNIIQKELIGEVGSLGTGMIPSDLILKTTSKSGVSNAVDMLQVKHVTGGISILRFKSYDQGRRAFEGEKIDVVWLDELPPTDVYSECYTRTITRNGIIFVTATPLDGLTPLVLAFYSQADFLPADTPLPAVVSNAKTEYEMEIEEARKSGENVAILSQKSSKAVVVAGWDDAPWLEEDAKVRILAATPPHLRQARSTGIPGDSGGMVFPIALSEITVDDFPIPAHYKFINGLDPGWHYTGAVFGALDPDTDTLYIYADYRRGQVETVVHAEAIKSKSKWADAPVIFDYAGMGGRPESESTRTLYRKYGLKLINADKAIESGLAEVWNRMSTGRLRIFKSCKILLQEISTYRRDDKGKIVKENDHVIDCLRYQCAGIKHARNMTTNTSSNLGSFKGQVSGRKYWS